MASVGFDDGVGLACLAALGVMYLWVVVRDWRRPMRDIEQLPALNRAVLGSQRRMYWNKCLSVPGLLAYAGVTAGVLGGMLGSEPDAGIDAWFVVGVVGLLTLIVAAGLGISIRYRRSPRWMIPPSVRDLDPDDVTRDT